MARMNSRNRREYDAATDAVLRAAGLSAVTGGTDTTGTGVSLNRLSAAYWDNKEQPNGVFIVNINVTALTLADSPGTTDLLTFIAQVGPTGFASNFEVGRVFDVRTPRPCPARK